MKKKIVILALHMGYGGVENSIATKASLLCNNFEVEIISLYRQTIDIPYNIDKRVKVTYLMNTISNREEFKDCVKHLNVIGIIKEGLKALSILLVKNKNIRNYIMQSNADVIISTRYEFTKILNKYGKNIIKIHEQHVYNVSKKYINKLGRFANIDYIMPVSKYIYDEYKKYLDRNKLYFIPLPLNYYPSNNEKSDLDSKNLIAVGRLDKIKGFDDLIKVMKIVVEHDNSVKLNIFGDGQCKEELNALLNKYNLNNNIKLWGFKEPNFIKKYYTNSTLYAMVSHEESFGLVVLESLSFGVPCIAFDDAKGCLDIIKDSGGVIIENRNINLMALKILEYLNKSKGEKKELGLKAQSIINNYKLDVIKKSWKEFLDSILDNGE